MGDFNVSFVSGGVIDRIKNIDLPERIAPLVDKNKSKGFLIDTAVDANVNDLFTLDYIAPYDLYISTILLRCDAFVSSDYWELFIDDRAMCETMYLLQKDDTVQISFTFYEKITKDSVIQFKYYNSSGDEKKVTVSLSYMYKNI